MEKSPNESEMDARMSELDAKIAESIKFPMPFEIKLEDLAILKQSLPDNKIQSKKELSNPERYLDYDRFQMLTSPKFLPLIKEIFENKIIADLGAGETSLGYQLAAKAGAKSYIGVEPYHAEVLRHSGGIGSLMYGAGEHDKNSEESFIPWCVVNTDMLSFLRSVKDDELSIILSGIDNFIIEDNEYLDEVQKEINRTLSSDGGILSILSDIYNPSFTPGNENSHLESDKTVNLYSGIKIYKK